MSHISLGKGLIPCPRPSDVVHNSGSLVAVESSNYTSIPVLSRQKRVDLDDFEISSGLIERNQNSKSWLYARVQYTHDTCVMTSGPTPSVSCTSVISFSVNVMGLRLAGGSVTVALVAGACTFRASRAYSHSTKLQSRQAGRQAGKRGAGIRMRTCKLLSFCSDFGAFG